MGFGTIVIYIKFGTDRGKEKNISFLIYDTERVRIEITSIGKNSI